MPLIQLLTHQAWTNTLFYIGYLLDFLIIIDIAHVQNTIFGCLVRFISFIYRVSIPLNHLLFHRSCSGIWRPCSLRFISGFYLLSHVAVRCIRNQTASNTINQHLFAIELHLMWPQLLYYLVNSFTEVFRLKMCSSFRTLIFLACIVIGVDAFIISKVYVFFSVYSCSCCLRLFFEFVLVLFSVWEII